MLADVNSPAIAAVAPERNVIAESNVETAFLGAFRSGKPFFYGKTKERLR